MTTPASNTPYAIIADAMEDAGLLREGNTPTPEQFVNYMRRLNDLINVMQIDGLKLWLNVDTAVPLVAAQAVYTFLPGGNVDMTKPLRAMEGYYLYMASNVRRPLTPLSWNDYLTLGQAGTLSSNQGPINQFFVNKKAASLEVTFWPCPDANEASLGVAHLLLQVQVTNPINLTETMNFPSEWRIALHWGLSAEICTGQPQEVISRCEGKAAQYKAALENWDVEDAPTRFTPDSRMLNGGGGSRFR